MHQITIPGWWIVFAAILIVFSCEKDDNMEALSSQVTSVTETLDGFEVVAKGLTIPWAIAVIGESEYLISERLGALYHYEDGVIAPLDDMPRVETVSDGSLTYGGIMDVSLHPDFDSNRLVYVAYVGTDFTMKVARFELLDNLAENVSVIFSTDAFSIGSRIAWQDKDHFFVSQGSGGNPFPEPGGQNLNSDVGKIHRLTKDGEVPEDNPVFDGFTGPSSIWSYGHRDPQGLYFDLDAQRLYSNEHGPLGGDELNIILKGENYGWPLFSNGLNYDGTPVSDMTEAEAGEISQLPIMVWTPAIAPSCLVKLESSSFEDLNGSFLIGALSQQSIVSYDLANGTSEQLWEGIGRVRDIAQLPSGDLLVTIDKNSPRAGDPGRLVKLTR
ncbi:MAG: PQQ-dependent sugar dehydrogenase [Bacteroidota bacterium]